MRPNLIPGGRGNTWRLMGKRSGLLAIVAGVIGWAFRALDAAEKLDWLRSKLEDSWNVSQSWQPVINGLWAAFTLWLPPVLIVMGFILIYLRSGHAPKVPSGDSAPASKPTGEAFAASANDLRAPDVRPLARLAREGEDLAAELRGTGVALFQRKKEVRQRILTWRNELAACLPNVKWLPIAPVPDSLVDCGPYVAERRDVLSAALKANQSEPRQVPFPVTGKPRFRLGPPHAVKEFHSNLRTREIGAGNVTFGQVEISNSGEQANAVQVRLTYRRANGTTITSVFGTWAEPGDPFRVESRVNFNPDDVHLLNVALRVSGEISAVDAQVLRDKRLWLPDHILDGTPYTVDIELLGQKLRVGVQPVGQDDIAVQPLSSD
jgi:hypothetical protein